MKIATTVSTKEGVSAGVDVLYWDTRDWLMYNDRNSLPRSSGGWEATAECWHWAWAFLLHQNGGKAREKENKSVQMNPFCNGTTDATQRMESA